MYLWRITGYAGIYYKPIEMDSIVKLTLYSYMKIRLSKTSNSVKSLFGLEQKGHTHLYKCTCIKGWYQCLFNESSKGHEATVNGRTLKVTLKISKHPFMGIVVWAKNCQTGRLQRT